MLLYSVLPLKAFAPSVKLREGETWEYLYVARERGAPANQYKVGKTKVSPDVRCQQLPGQTDAEFDMLAVFLTLRSTDAENLAFEEFDKQGWRKYPGTRKEIFVATLENLCEVCVVAAAQANRIVRSDLFLAQVARPRPLTSSHQVRHSNPFWKEALRAPVKVGRECMELGELLARALTDSAWARRLARMGFNSVARFKSKIDYEVDWHKAGSVLNWLQSRGYASPSQFLPQVQFNVVEARQSA